MSDLRYAPCDPAAPELAALIARHAAHGDAHYPADSNHHQDGAALAAEGTVLFVGWDGPTPVAMAGYKPIAPGHGEVKSMHVAEAARGKGAGRHLLDMIIDHARAAGFDRLSLETGSRAGSAAARRLYESAGFDYTAPFGAYAADPLSVFMTRDLTQDSPQPIRYKQALVLRTDLKMRRGKEIAQGAHASMKAALENLDHPDVRAWLSGPFAKIALGCEGEEALRALDLAAREAGLITALITDAGRTEFGGVPTVTALAVGPAAAARVDAITGHLKLR